MPLLQLASTRWQHQYRPGPESRQDVSGREAGKRDPSITARSCGAFRAAQGNTAKITSVLEGESFHIFHIIPTYSHYSLTCPTVGMF